MIQDILAVVDNAEAAGPFLKEVVAFADTRKALVEIAALTPSPYVADEILPVGGMYVPDEVLAKEAEKKVAAVDALVGAAPAVAKLFGLHDDIGWLAGDLRRSRQIADLIVIGAEAHWETSWLRRRVIETSILASGTPTLILPSGRGLGAVRHAVLGWKPSPEANRAVHDLVGIAEARARIDIVIVDQDAGKDAGDEVSRHLFRHGLRPELHRLDSDGLDDASVLHGFALRSRADLLAIGGFGHSRLREIVLGGVTRDLIADAEVPVMLSR